MTITLVDLGSAANDGTGDDLRTAFEKVNANTEYLFGVAEQTGQNLGSAGSEVFKVLESNVFYFRKLVAGTNVSLNETENTIEINNTMPASRFIVSGNSGTVIAGDGINLTLTGTEATRITAAENGKIITFDSRLERETTPKLGAALLAQDNDISDVGQLGVREIFVQNITPQNIKNVPYEPRLGRYIAGLDFGELEEPVRSALDYVIRSVGVDFGTIENDNPIEVELGTIV
jgi:hypothetical protein